MKEMEDLVSSMDTECPIMGMKVLAAGKIPPQEALEYTFGIPNIDIVTVGVTEEWQVIQLTEIVDSIHNISIQ
jgi:hypothetical protein